MTHQKADQNRIAGMGEPDQLDWKAIFLDHVPRVYNYFRFRLGSEADVQELTSQTFERAWRSRAHYQRDLAGFATWLFTIAKNVAVDYLHTRKSHLPIEAALDVPADGTPEYNAEHTSNLARLAFLTNGLPDRERELVALKYGADLSNRLIARVTSLSESNVGTILHRVVVSLRDQW